MRRLLASPRESKWLHFGANEMKPLQLLQADVHESFTGPGWKERKRFCRRVE